MSTNGNGSKAERLANSVTLMLAARLVSVILAPIALALFFWIASSLQTLTVTVAVLQQQIDERRRAAEEHARRLDRLEEWRNAGGRQ